MTTSTQQRIAAARYRLRNADIMYPMAEGPVAEHLRELARREKEEKHDD